MNEKILVVDDDFGTVKLIESILTKNNLIANCFTSPLDALKSFDMNEYDLVLSDFFMPEINGEEFLNIIRSKNKYIPFIVLTVNNDIQNAINLLKEGADDYISKPIVKEELIFRIQKNIEEKKNRKILDRIEKEKEILSLESKRMVNWKLLYATKDVKQTDQIINLFTRTLNQGGGFIWLDILKTQTEKIDEEYYKIHSALINLIIKSAEQNQLFFDNITFLSNLDSMDVQFKPYSYTEMINIFHDYIQNDLNDIAEKYKRKFIIQKANQNISGDISLNIPYFQKMLKELFINAIKYSPEDTNIYFMVEKNTSNASNYGKNIDISIKNTPKKMNAKDLDGNDIIGIPYEYSELVFDLFYTIEAFPTGSDDEEWNNGTGLYIVRKIVKRHNGWIKTANGIDYTKGAPEPYVKFSITLPYN
ncbi:MAG: hypothetical protein A2086_04070 [Spirochaetes bacterium GWD1_27_9]|nr:MAG: hypothetical protein A2Z98_09150 [Spirochaetes bacterium GWB1_27_13]OHD24793.1 MAG: hypothetical protein A2Y34_05890 [Spirochaetes bacterium GWC1_27_15]OHD45198.1 MAG: hypothetical protein A2086_04070 [Spirochaetes bacterium GWD1_27_9]